MSSSQATSSISSICVVSSAAAPPTIAKYTIPSAPHRLDRLVGQPALAADRAHAVLAPSGSVKRTMRALVVVPMQIFS